jgi:GH24 family phage-related lysozyme (muramidase)
MELDKTTDYAAELQDFLVGAEGAEYTPYADTAGIPSIGYGYNLQDRNVREAVLEILGFDVSAVGWGAKSRRSRRR